MAATVTVNHSAYTLIAQQVLCAYPISDIYNPTPRILFYALLAAIFVSPRSSWLAGVFLAAASSYAAAAAINAFIVTAAGDPLKAPQAVTIPYVDPNGTYEHPIITGTNEVIVQQDAVELDLDTVLAIVVTAYLTGLPLQAWSRTGREHRVVHYMILLWNLILLAATICALISWPITNTAPIQYRFCYAGYLDASPLRSPGWEEEGKYWQGTWNSTIWYIFDHPNTVWENLTYGCFYPCFNTSTILRKKETLQVATGHEVSEFAKMHDPIRWSRDHAAPLIYAAIVTFTAIQGYLLLAARFHFCSKWVPIYDPTRLWTDRRYIWHSFNKASAESARVMHQVLHRARRKIWRGFHVEIHHDDPLFKKREMSIPLQFCLDIFTFGILIGSLTLFPVVIICFIIWIEWYIRNDGSPSESAAQVGQWAFPVALAIVFIAAFIYQFKDRLASRDELMSDIAHSGRHLERLKKRLREKNRESVEQALKSDT